MEVEFYLKSLSSFRYKETTTTVSQCYCTISFGRLNRVVFSRNLCFSWIIRTRNILKIVYTSDSVKGYRVANNDRLSLIHNKLKSPNDPFKLVSFLTTNTSSQPQDAGDDMNRLLHLTVRLLAAVHIISLTAVCQVRMAAGTKVSIIMLHHRVPSFRSVTKLAHEVGAQEDNAPSNGALLKPNHLRRLLPKSSKVQENDIPDLDKEPSVS